MFALNPLSEAYEPIGTLKVGKPSDEARPAGVAVDTKGNVFVADKASKAIAKFSPAGVEVGQIGVGFPAESVAVDGKGNLYVLESPQGGDDLGRVVELPANGTGEIEPGTQPIEIAQGGSFETRPRGIAVDQSANELYVVFRDRVEQYDPTGERVGEFDLSTLEGRMIAVNGQSGLVYVFGAYFGPGGGSTPGVQVFGPTVITPDPITGAVSDLTVSSATLQGTVNAAGALPASCEFQYVEDASFKVKGFEGALTAPCSPAGPFTGTSAEPVSAAISALASRTLYDYRLVASSANGTTRGKALKFFTPGLPFINDESVSGLTGTTATLEALVNPAAGETSYVFEYVTEADFEASGYAKATIVPVGGETIGSGFENVSVAQTISGLAPSANYLFRAVATNPLGSTTGPDRFFATLGPNGFELPDGRVFEQVTPVDKNGSAPMGAAHRIQASPDGDRLAYFSHGGIPGLEGAQRFPIYLATRGADWSTQGQLPPASGGSAAAVLGWSEDLSRSYLAQSDPTAPETKLLERDTLTRSLRPITVEGNDLGTFNYVGAPPSGAAVFFESDTVLSPGGASNAPNLYVWDKGSGEIGLAGVLNNGQAPAKGTLAGSNELAFRDHYLQAPAHVVSTNGSRVFFTDVASGQLYMRQNPTQPQSALDGAGKCTEAALACTVQVSASQRAVPDPKGKKPATFWAATPDGSKSFFTTPGKLTDDATTGPNDEGNDLYRYDAESGVLTDLTPDGADANGADVLGVVGTGGDGAYVYFAANGVLTVTPNPQGESAAPGDCDPISYDSDGDGACNLYLSHNGTIVFIAPLSQAGAYEGSDSGNWISSAARPEENTARVSVDGETLLFRSRLPLTGYENKGFPEFLRYSASDGGLECISCNPSGAAPTGRATLRSISISVDTGPFSAPVLSRNLSAGGDRVFFETPDKLVASDINGDAGCPSSTTAARACQDVYEWESKGTGSCHSAHQNGGCLHLISTGESSEASFIADIDEEGNNAFFYTEQSLVSQDKDQILDIYDARIGGGIASQNPSPPSICEGEACKGPVPPAPMPPASPGSASFSGPPSAKPSRNHKKRHHKKVKKKQQHKKRHLAKRNG